MFRLKNDVAPKGKGNRLEEVGVVVVGVPRLLDCGWLCLKTHTA